MDQEPSVRISRKIFFQKLSCRPFRCSEVKKKKQIYQNGSLGEGKLWGAKEISVQKCGRPYSKWFPSSDWLREWQGFDLRE